MRELGIFGQSHGCEIKQPGANDAAAAPDFGDVWQIEFESLVLG